MTRTGKDLPCRFYRFEIFGFHEILPRAVKSSEVFDMDRSLRNKNEALLRNMKCSRIALQRSLA